MIRQNQLEKKILLRYLPIPLLLKMENSAEFIDIFNHETYETPTLIWNDQMLNNLKFKLKNQLTNFKARLCQTFKGTTLNDQRVLVIEKFDFHLVHCFKYPFIENQVKCGKYYLRVWVEQNLLDFQTEEYFNSVRIPYQEEEQFQFNLKAALQECIRI